MKILIGGSPCTYWSIAQTKDREIEPRGLGWELFKNYLIALDKYQPDYFLYENNKSMAAAIRAQITHEFGFEPICINSALVSAQSRQRLYWLGRREPDGTYSRVEVEQPSDQGIYLRDILETGIPWREKGYALQTAAGATAEDMLARRERNGVAEPINTTLDGKSGCLRASDHKIGIRNLVGNEIDPRTGVAEPVCVNPTPGEKARTVDAHMGKLENNLVPRINDPNPNKQQYDCIAQAVRVDDGQPKGIDHLGSLYGRHSRWGMFGTDGKSPTVTASAGQGGGHIPMVPEPVRVGTVENNAARPEHNSKQYRVYSPNGKATTICGNGGGAGAITGLYTVPFQECDYTVLDGAAVRITDRAIRQQTSAGTRQEKWVYLPGAEKSNAIIAGQAAKGKIMEPLPPGTWKQVYEVKGGGSPLKESRTP